MIIIILNERRTKILIKIINANLPIKVDELASLFKVSNRTIRYDLNKIDEFLKHNNLPQLIRKPNIGVKFSNLIKDKNEVLKLLGNVNFYHYALKQNERINIILSDLIGYRDYTTINNLAEKLMVSRPTIINDLKYVRRWLQDHDLELESMPKYGIKVLGNENKLRKAAIELIMETMDIDKALDIIKTPIYKKINVGMDNEIRKLFADIDLEYIEECIKMAERELNTIFSDIAYTGIVIHIAIAIKRIQLGKDIIIPRDELESLKNTREFKVALNIAKMLEDHFHIILPIDEVGYITIHFLGSNITNTKRRENKNQIDYRKLAERIIKTASSLLGMDLLKDRQLINGLTDHLIPTIYRLKHELDLKNPIVAEIKNNYGKLFEIVKHALKPIEDYTEKKLTEDEIAYFVMHFGAAIERLNGQEIIRPNILIVCSTGIGTAKMLSTRLKSIFNVNVVGTVAYHQINETLKDRHVDLIISTIPIESKKVNTVVVSPLLNDNDIELIKQYIVELKQRHEFKHITYESCVNKQFVENIIFKGYKLGLDVIKEFHDELTKERIEGLLLHILLMINRLAFNSTYKMENIHEINTSSNVLKRLKSIFDRNGIDIPESEIVTIIQYFK
ncbi:BglG family transcription antiterminator [Thermoanaerobacterium thermosaccharolyticum]|uniref:Transcriptional antiterminator, BglG n=2 Tax=Thermoanaerobacterium thermosaccharolyticum TaxID=1517 RepID=D9TQF6_THETC|nr:transcription antiterminator [Thermoanaerobacterium thermosaccharolyticum]ADL69190.1 transcriptional antiterminator, BglG [Thermoanaerobacterium thermosaccharolyticum DSM 571]AGB19323.1 transcriptional antiterminator [Thermoanaerobacterium thermosaccharolyticum M0795]